jgi:hypothetical protein
VDETSSAAKVALDIDAHETGTARRYRRMHHQPTPIDQRGTHRVANRGHIFDLRAAEGERRREGQQAEEGSGGREDEELGHGLCRVSFAVCFVGVCC